MVNNYQVPHRNIKGFRRFQIVSKNISYSANSSNVQNTLWLNDLHKGRKGIKMFAMQNESKDQKSSEV